MLTLPGFRAVPLDGARLYFEPRTGTHVRVANDATTLLRRQAPRVVMFGITNVCNLRCSFCSRDAAAESQWTVESAAQTLRDLASAGVLEVAFGGGEPLAFAGFAELVRELRLTTSLAMHVTTNGTLVTPSRWLAFADAIGIARLSIYDDVPWHSATDVWRDQGQRFGANVLVDDAMLPRLPALLAEVAARGAVDVSILTHVGGDTRQQLSPDGTAHLTRILGDAPIAIRVSVCAGDSVRVARLPTGTRDGGDCGAGYDFITVTPDKRLQACSFAPQDFPARNANEILAGWRLQQPRLMQASSRIGCARALPLVDEQPPPPPIAIWQSFAGNNSGECVMVARFETVFAAEELLADLLPGWTPDAPWSDEWRTLMAAAKIAVPAVDDQARTYVDTPRSLVSLGSSVIALGYDADDQFAELRHFAWRRNADTVTGVVHAHESLELLAVIRNRDAAEAQVLATHARTTATARTWTHGRDAILTIGFADDHHAPDGLPARKVWLENLAAGCPFSVDVIEAPSEADVTAALQRLGVELPTSPRVQLSFMGYGDTPAITAADFAAHHAEQPMTVVGRVILVEPVHRPRRLAVQAARVDGAITVLHGRDVLVRTTFWIDEPSRQRGVKAQRRELDAAAIKLHTRTLPILRDVTTTANRSNYLTVLGTTAEPARVMRAHAAIATAHDLRVNISVSDVAPLGWTLRRLRAELNGQ